MRHQSIPADSSLQCEESWIPVRGYESTYHVSSVGRVKNVKTGRILTPQIQWGYFALHLWNFNKHKVFLVHRLVASVFLGEPDADRTEVNHKDGNKLNNYVDNLEWVTRGENQRHAYRTGLRKPSVINGECHHFAKLKKPEAMKIVSLLPEHSDDEIARMFRVRRGTIWHIRAGKTWKSIPRGNPLRRALALCEAETIPIDEEAGK